MMGGKIRNAKLCIMKNIKVHNYKIGLKKITCLKTFTAAVSCQQSFWVEPFFLTLRSPNWLIKSWRSLEGPWCCKITSVFESQISTLLDDIFQTYKALPLPSAQCGSSLWLGSDMTAWWKCRCVALRWTGLKPNQLIGTYACGGQRQHAESC